MRTLFLLNPTAGKADCTRTLPQQINAAAARAGLAPEEYTIQVTNHAGHARELANAAAQQARQSGEELRVSLPAATAPSTKRSPGSMAMQMQPWAVCPLAAATIFCAPLGQRKSFWIWMPSWPVGR